MTPMGLSEDLVDLLEVHGADLVAHCFNSYLYNGAGDLLSLRDGRGNVIAWTYDLNGRVTSKRDANNVEILRYQYDALGRLTNRWTAAKGTTSYVYDALGNLRSTIYPERTLGTVEPKSFDLRGLSFWLLPRRERRASPSWGCEERATRAAG